jgi:membrane protease YdiL (CAAX protease family)
MRCGKNFELWTSNFNFRLMLPEKTWKTESVLRLLLGVFASLCIGVLLAGALDKLNPDWPQSRTKLLSMVIITIAFHGAALLWIRNLLKEENISWKNAFGFNTQNQKRSVALGIIAAVLVLPVAWGLQQLSARVMTSIHFHPEPQQVVQDLQEVGVSFSQQIYLAFVALIAAPIVEEMLFRGILYPTIKRAGFPKLALWGNSILFALTHQNAPAFLPLVFFAMILTLLYEETGNLLSPIVAHSCFNAANFVLLLFAEHFRIFDFP